jgi:predicted membrane protein (TIGR00267 family)
MSTNAELYLRNVIFGISDSLVSTVGLLAGIDVSGTTRQIIILTGIVYAFVEAFSMAVGSFISEQSTEEYAVKEGEKSAAPGNQPLVGGVVMFVSFVLTSFIPIVPYFLFGAAAALWASIGFSIIALFIVGIVSARISKVNLWRRGLQTMLLGGAAIVIGVLVGKFVKTN